MSGPVVPTVLVTNIQRYSIHDGPGIRTTVFFKGCNLHCPWCHNPEAVKAAAELFYHEEKCTRCGSCGEVCPVRAHRFTAGGGHIFDRPRCTLCGACTAVCLAGALETAASPVGLEELVELILRDRPFYQNSGGGVTFSGGEPFLQGDFLTALLRACKEAGISTAVETALQVPGEALLAALPYTDLFMVDFKHPRQQSLKETVGADLDMIMDNLALLVRKGANPLVRIPVIPGFNMETEIMEEIRGLLLSLGITRIELLPFHNLAASKYRSLGLDYPYGATPPPSTGEMEKLKAMFPGDTLWPAN